MVFVLLALQVGLRGDGLPVGGDGVSWCGAVEGPMRIYPGRPLGRGQAVDQVVLGGEHQIGGTEEGVRPGGEHLQVHRLAVGRACREQRGGTGRAADPVALHGFDLLRPVQHVEVVEQPVGVGGDPHHPLPQPLPEHREVTAVASAVSGDLFVGQHGAQPGTPVHDRIRPVDQSVSVDHVGTLPCRQLRPIPAVIQFFGAGIECGNQIGDRSGNVGGGIKPRVVDLQEDPLCPLVELDVGGGKASPVVVAEAQPAQLAPEIDDVGLGPGPRVGAGLHRVLLGGQTERVKAQRVQHITADHPEVAGIDVGGDVAQRVTDVQPLARRIREHVLDEHLVVGHS